MQQTKTKGGRKRNRVPKDSENYNVSNIIPQDSENAVAEKYDDISAKASCGHYNPSRGPLEVSLGKDPKTNSKLISDARQSAFSTHKRRKVEEEKENPPNGVFSAVPQRSGELVCDEELSIDENSSAIPRGSNAYVMALMRDGGSGQVSLNSQRSLKTDLVRY